MHLINYKIRLVRFISELVISVQTKTGSGGLNQIKLDAEKVVKDEIRFN